MDFKWTNTHRQTLVYTFSLFSSFALKWFFPLLGSLSLAMYDDTRTFRSSSFSLCSFARLCVLCFSNAILSSSPESLVTVVSFSVQKRQKASFSPSPKPHYHLVSYGLVGSLSSVMVRSSCCTAHSPLGFRHHWGERAMSWLWRKTRASHLSSSFFSSQMYDSINMSLYIFATPFFHRSCHRVSPSLPHCTPNPRIYYIQYDETAVSL